MTEDHDIEAKVNGPDVNKYLHINFIIFSKDKIASYKSSHEVMNRKSASLQFL